MGIEREINHRVTCDHVFRWVEVDDNGSFALDPTSDNQVRERPCEVAHLHRGEDLDAAVFAYESDGWREVGESWFCPAHAPADDTELDAMAGHGLQDLAAALRRAEG